MKKKNNYLESRLESSTAAASADRADEDIIVSRFEIGPDDVRSADKMRRFVHWRVDAFFNRRDSTRLHMDPCCCTKKQMAHSGCDQVAWRCGTAKDHIYDMDRPMRLHDCLTKTKIQSIEPPLRSAMAWSEKPMCPKSTTFT